MPQKNDKPQIGRTAICAIAISLLIICIGFIVISIPTQFVNDLFAFIRSGSTEYSESIEFTNGFFSISIDTAVFFEADPLSILLCTHFNRMITATGFLLICILLIKILNTVVNNEPFHYRNHVRLWCIGLVWSSFLGYRLMGSLLDRIGIMPLKSFSDSVHVSFSTSDLTQYAMCLIIFVVAEVFKSGTKIQEETDMTI